MLHGGRGHAREERAILEATEDVVGRVADAAEVNVRECQRRVALRRLVEGPEFLDAAPRQVDGEALDRVDEIRLQSELYDILVGTSSSSSLHMTRTLITCSDVSSM